MRIGIGITTYLRPDCLTKCVESIHKHTDMSNVTLHIADDSIERKGVAFRKNECLRALKNCDYVFLFDDDCYPIKDGWVEFFTRAGENHLLFLNDKLHNLKDVQGVNGVKYYNDCGGVFMYMTKDMIKRVGAFDERYDTFGFEHADWSIRCNGCKTFMMLEGTEDYLYSEDYSNANHKSSISKEDREFYVKKNWNIFFNHKKSVYLPL
jgi:glycosyltransferase involved in cell wall biosynthesis